MGNFHSLYCAYNTLSCIMKIRINGNENGHKAVERKRSIYEKNNVKIAVFLSRIFLILYLRQGALQ